MCLVTVILTERKICSKSFDRHCGDIKDHDHSLLRIIIRLALILKIDKLKTYEKWEKKRKSG